MPGVQKPHCRAPAAANAAAKRSLSVASNACLVVVDLPAAFSSEIWQLTDALPSISTVQHPHWPDGEQPSLGDVTSSSSRKDRKSTRLNSSHLGISYAVFCLKKKKKR